MKYIITLRSAIGITDVDYLKQDIEAGGECVVNKIEIRDVASVCFETDRIIDTVEVRDYLKEENWDPGLVEEDFDF